MSYCTYSSSDVTHAYIGATSINLRARVDYDSSGQGIFNPPAAQRFNSTFFNQMSAWINEYDSQLANWLESGASHVDWVGHVGIYGHCDTSAATMHHTGRAFDVGRIQLNSGWFVDTNWSWNQSLLHKRRYLSTALYLRRYFKTVLTTWYNSDHHNHIHVDNGSTLGPISSSSKADTVIIQAACNLMNAEALTVNGTWNTATDQAFSRLRSRMGLNCLNIRGNLDHTKIFLGVLSNDAANNVRAGTYQWGVC
jgi:hypothetical protein